MLHARAPFFRLFSLISINPKPLLDEHQAPLGHGHALASSPTG